MCSSPSVDHALGIDPAVHPITPTVSLAPLLIYGKLVHDGKFLKFQQLNRPIFGKTLVTRFSVENLGVLYPLNIRDHIEDSYHIDQYARFYQKNLTATETKLE